MHHLKHQTTPQIPCPKAQSGFTLFEFLLYLGLSTLTMLVITMFLISLIEARIKNQTITEVEQQGLQIMQTITQTIRNSENIYAPTSGITAGTLSLDALDRANDPTAFDLQGNTMRIREGVATPIALVNSRLSVSNLTFQNTSRLNTPGTIRIQFTLTYNNTAGRREYSFTKTFTGSATLRQP